MSTDTSVQPFFSSFLISTLVPLALSFPVKSYVLTQWLKVPNSHHHCSYDSNAFSTLA